jgi:hypothetical protein
MKTLSTSILIILFSVSALAKGSSEQQTLSKARKLFEQKNFKEALVEYNKITAQSDRYLMVLEEKAWTYIHLDQMNKALAASRTLTSPSLSGLTTTEPFLLRALVQLKLCDYLGVFQTLKDFRTQKREQVVAIQDIAQKRQNSISRQTLEQWIKDTANWKSLGSNLAKMPQLFYTDSIMLAAAKAKNMSRLEKRLQQLAVIENNENHRILQKLNLIEVEGVQRVHIASQFNNKQGETLEKSDDDLVFKDSKDDVWLDELDSYQATVDRCEKKSGRTM